MQILYPNSGIESTSALTLGEYAARLAYARYLLRTTSVIVAASFGPTPETSDNCASVAVNTASTLPKWSCSFETFQRGVKDCSAASGEAYRPSFPRPSGLRGCRLSVVVQIATD